MGGRRFEDVLRFWAPAGLLVLFAAYCGQKLVRAHLKSNVKPPKYELKYEIPGRRGSIYDSDGTRFPLVKSVPVWEFTLDPVALTNRVVKPDKVTPPRERNAILKTVADTLGIDYRKVLKMADTTGRRGWRNQWLGESYDPEVYRVLADSKLVAGVGIKDKQVRQYLCDRRLAHVLGSVNAEGVGTVGIERRFDRDMRGVPGKVSGMKDAHGHEIYDRRKVDVAPVPGADIFLTVDHNIQYEVESALAWGVKEFGAGSGWSVVLDAKTGAVLAMASLPDFDPMFYGQIYDRVKRGLITPEHNPLVNRVVNFTYEPGSVMKVITASAAIDCGLVGPETTYSTNRDDDRYYRLPGDGSHVWDPRMSVRDAVAKSSNIVIGKLGVDLGPERLWGYMKAFGFGNPTGIELPAEEAGILPFWKKWDKVKWSRAPIGQGVSVTALQLASAYQALANDGVRMEPYIVERVVDASGNALYEHAPKALGRVVKAVTARRMRDVMTGVASPKGTARRAAIRGYSVAGKTGTAQKVVNKRYSDHLFRATFCGIVPAGVVKDNDPRFVILVTLDFEERAKFHQGGNSAGPVFRRIATGTLRYKKVPPDRPDELLEFDDDDEYDRIMEERARKCSDADL